MADSHALKTKSSTPIGIRDYVSSAMILNFKKIQYLLARLYWVLEYEYLAYENAQQ